MTKPDTGLAPVLFPICLSGQTEMAHIIPALLHPCKLQGPKHLRLWDGCQIIWYVSRGPAWIFSPPLPASQPLLLGASCEGDSVQLSHTGPCSCATSVRSVEYNTVPISGKAARCFQEPRTTIKQMHKKGKVKKKINQEFERGQMRMN